LTPLGLNILLFGLAFHHVEPLLRHPLKLTLAILALVPLRPAQGFEIRIYNAIDHKRFDNFPSAPTVNPNQLFAAQDLSGIGWLATSPDIQYALISRQHLVFATHFASAIGSHQVRFLNASNQVIARTGSSLVTIEDDSSPSDLKIITLNAPIDEDQGVTPLSYYNLTPTDFGSVIIGIAGKRDESGDKFGVIGRDTISTVESTSRTEDYGASGMLTTRYMSFDYSKRNGDAHEGLFEVGDSGSPTFTVVDGKAALIGTHSYVVEMPSKFLNYDVFVPHYASALDAQMAPLGYRMRPASFSPTTLTGTTSTVQPTPRQALPLALEFAIENTGANLTGNLEVEFSFPTGQAPDSISADGWVTYGSGTKWTLRKATLEAAASGTLTASWTAAPIIGAITPTITWRSDTVADQSATPTISLSPSYTAWAIGLTEGGLTDDPDQDQLLNHVEYALGGDPENGLALLQNDEELLPSIASIGSLVVYTYPERVDKLARGLSYVLEWSTDLAPASFSTTPPAGFTSSTAAYVPDVPGFVKRTITWPASEPFQFVRLGISLSE